MAKDIQLKKADGDIFADQGSSWMALDLPEVKPPLYSKAFIIFLTAFIVTGVTYSAVTKVPVVIESGGKLATSKPAVPVRSVFNFTVSSLRVKENQIVKAGDILVSSDEGFSPEELVLVKKIETGLAFINSQEPVNQCPNCEPVARQIFAAASKLSKHKTAGNIMKPIAESSRVLAELSAKLKSVDKQLQPAKTRIASLSASPSGRTPASTAGSAKELQKLKSQIDQVYTPYYNVMEKNRTHLAALTKATGKGIDELMKISGVRSPVEGKIVNVRLKGAGELVGSGQPVMEIIPSDNEIVANIEVLNRDIGSVRVGDVVEVSVDAYPEIDYGILKGKVSDILPVDGSESPGPLGIERGFKVRVSLDSQEFSAGGQKLALLPGMTIRARTIKKSETLLKKLYRAVFRVKEDSRMHRS
jgi:adhesin transport system membrane fusion protein